MFQPTSYDVRRILAQAVKDLGPDSKNAEIAFFGGSFTAIDREYMITLLEATREYIGVFKGIRISTRPDCIDKDILEILKSYCVTSIELGAQSMDNDVLFVNRRGHTAQDVINASQLIKEYGFSLGLQMMTGLYKSSYEKDIYTAKQFIKLRPDTVRIYPTITMKNTYLAELYDKGEFIPSSIEDSIEVCSRLINMFTEVNINIIRLGLHYSESLIQNSLGNNYHPAFKELCENRIFYNKFLEEVNGLNSKEVIVYINEKSLSKFLGQKKSNLNKFNELGYKIDIKFDNTLEKYELYIK